MQLIKTMKTLSHNSEAAGLSPENQTTEPLSKTKGNQLFKIKQETRLALLDFNQYLGT